MDLLFYHLRLRSFVVVELKTEAFKPEFAGKMNFYLSAVDDLWCHPSDNPSIGLILCKTRKRLVAEDALRNTVTPIGLLEYRLGGSLPRELKGSCRTVEGARGGTEPHGRRRPAGRGPEAKGHEGQPSKLRNGHERGGPSMSQNAEIQGPPVRGTHAAWQLRFDANQEFQLSAIQAVALLFEGQPRIEAEFRWALGAGFSAIANRLDLDDTALLTNLQATQTASGLTPDFENQTHRGDGRDRERSGGSPIPEFLGRDGDGHGQDLRLYPHLP